VLKASSLISEVARSLLQPYVRFSEVGQHALEGFEGEHLFYGL